MCGGDKPTFADYFLIIAVAELQQCILDPNTRNSLNNMNNHFKKVAAMDEVKSRLGNLKQGKKQMMATCLTTKKEAAPAPAKNNKKPAKKQ